MIRQGMLIKLRWREKKSRHFKTNYNDSKSLSFLLFCFSSSPLFSPLYASSSDFYHIFIRHTKSLNIRIRPIRIKPHGEGTLPPRGIPAMSVPTDNQRHTRFVKYLIQYWLDHNFCNSLPSSAASPQLPPPFPFSRRDSSSNPPPSFPHPSRKF